MSRRDGLVYDGGYIQLFMGAIETSQRYIRIVNPQPESIVGEVRIVQVYEDGNDVFVNFFSRHKAGDECDPREGLGQIHDALQSIGIKGVMPTRDEAIETPRFGLPVLFLEKLEEADALLAKLASLEILGPDAARRQAAADAVADGLNVVTTNLGIFRIRDRRLQATMMQNLGYDLQALYKQDHPAPVAEPAPPGRG